MTLIAQSLKRHVTIRIVERGAFGFIIHATMLAVDNNNPWFKALQLALLSARALYLFSVRNYLMLCVEASNPGTSLFKDQNFDLAEVGIEPEAAGVQSSALSSEL